MSSPIARAAEKDGCLGCLVAIPYAFLAFFISQYIIEYFCDIVKSWSEGGQIAAGLLGFLLAFALVDVLVRLLLFLVRLLLCLIRSPFALVKYVKQRRHVAALRAAAKAAERKAAEAEGEAEKLAAAARKPQAMVKEAEKNEERARDEVERLKEIARQYESKAAKLAKKAEYVECDATDLAEEIEEAERRRMLCLGGEITTEAGTIQAEDEDEDDLKKAEKAKNEVVEINGKYYDVFGNQLNSWVGLRLSLKKRRRRQR